MFPEAEDDEEKNVLTPAVTSGPAAFLIGDV